MPHSFVTRKNSRSLVDAFYTKPNIVRDITNQFLIPLIHDYAITNYIDFSAGDAFVSFLLAPFLQNIENYDLYPSSNSYQPIVKKDWLNVDESTGDGSRTMIGFNPPFGYKGEMAFQFITHAAKTFQPQFICSIVPKHCSGHLQDYSFHTVRPMHSDHYLPTISTATVFVILKREQSNTIDFRDLPTFVSAVNKYSDSRHLLKDVPYHSIQYSLDHPYTHLAKCLFVYRLARSKGRVIYTKDNKNWSRFDISNNGKIRMENCSESHLIHPNKVGSFRWTDRCFLVISLQDTVNLSQLAINILNHFHMYPSATVSICSLTPILH